MAHNLNQIVRSLHPRRLKVLSDYLLKDEAISGKLIIAVVVLALIAANSFLSSFYNGFWNTELSIGLGDWKLSMDLKHWVSEALMAFFFLVVGLELRRELAHGELRKRKTAILPFAAALGGMIVPALIYVAFNAGSESINGWAIPTATDIALAIGVLALLGKRIPSSVRIFLLTLAIVDDVLAVTVIGVFYSTGINVSALFIGSAISLAIFLTRNSKFVSLPVFVIVGIILWLVVYKSGIHSSIAGAILGLLAPLAITNISGVSIAERLEKAVIPFSTLVVVPLFAFASTGIALNLSSLENSSSMSIAGGIFFGLVAGKAIGIVGATWLMIKLGYANLPADSTWNHIIGVGILAGIGFTVSIFVTELAFTNDQIVGAAKISIFIASLFSAVIGYTVLRYLNPKTGKVEFMTK